MRLFSQTRGSAVLEFVFVVTPFLLTTSTITGIFLSTNALNVLRDSSIEGARFAALADQSTIDGCERTRDLITKALNVSTSLEVKCYSFESSNSQYERVSARLSLQIIGLLAMTPTLYAESSAPRENQ